MLDYAAITACNRGDRGDSFRFTTSTHTHTHTRTHLIAAIRNPAEYLNLLLLTACAGIELLLNSPMQASMSYLAPRLNLDLGIPHDILCGLVCFVHTALLQRRAAAACLSRCAFKDPRDVMQVEQSRLSQAIAAIQACGGCTPDFDRSALSMSRAR